ncbi:MAG: phage major capsid protein [Synergistaceae bacterium]|nr:phage major capsid protein [Synergistaceae bacterium]
MRDNRKMIKDAIDTTAITGAGKGGRLSPDQVKRFISYMTDETALLADIRTEIMNAPEKTLDLLLIGSRQLERAAEGQGPTQLAGATFKRKELRAVKVRLAADVTTEWGEDNIERAEGQDRIARDLAQQFGNDRADLLLNGDTTATGPDAAFLNIGDGIIKQAKDSADTHKVDVPAGADPRTQIFPMLLEAMPNKFKRAKDDLRFYCSSSVAERYVLSLADRVTAGGDALLNSGSGDVIRYLGIRLFPVEYMPDDVVIFTNRHNIVCGVQRDMKVYSQFAQRKDQTEYTMYMRIDPGKIVYDDALAIAYPM